MEKLKLSNIFLCAFLILFLGFQNSASASTHSNYVPLKNDAIALEFAPKFILDDESFNKPIAMYYRMSTDSSGNTYIAYHPTWTNEINNSKGVLSYLNRIIYTGGLSLQKYIFGKGDVESIEVLIDKNKNIKKITYETAKDYNPQSGVVNHQKVILTENLQKPLIFHVMSWNHLFTMDQNNSGEQVNIIPTYFTKELWDEYEMSKSTYNPFKKNRAFFDYELEYVS